MRIDSGEFIIGLDSLVSFTLIHIPGVRQRTFLSSPLPFGGLITRVSSYIGFDAVENPIQCAFEAVVVGKLCPHLDETSDIRKLASRKNRTRKPGLMSWPLFALCGTGADLGNLHCNKAVHKHE